MLVHVYSFRFLSQKFIMNQHPKKVIADKFRGSVVDVFKLYAGECFEVETAEADFEVANLLMNCDPDKMVTAEIGMEGPAIDASLFLIASTNTIAQTSSEVVSDSMDWIGELANLVLGLFKRKLGEFGLTADLGLPKRCAGIRLESPAGIDERDALVVRTEFGEILAVLNGRTEKDPAGWKQQPQFVNAE